MFEKEFRWNVLVKKVGVNARGVFRGGGALCHGPPFGSLGLQNCIVK